MTSDSDQAGGGGVMRSGQIYFDSRPTGGGDG